MINHRRTQRLAVFENKSIERESSPRGNPANVAQPVHLDAWRVLLAAKAICDAGARIQSIQATRDMEPEEAAALASVLQGATRSLADLSRVLAPGELRTRARDTLEAFTRWQAAPPHSNASRRLAEAFTGSAQALIEVAKRDSVSPRRREHAV